MKSWRLAVLVVGLGSACVRPPSGGVDAGTRPDAGGAALLPFEFADAGGVLWVGAHPDDELYVAPLLGEVCARLGKPCSLYVLTNGGKGKCLLDGGCHPDVATVRRGELAASGGVVHAQLEAQELEDSPAGDVEGVLGAWNSSLDGGLLERMKARLRQLPDGHLLVVFDPRHGVTCHLDHRASGALALLAAREVGLKAESIYLVTSTLAVGALADGGLWAGSRAFVTGDPAVRLYDAAPRWDLVSAVLASHPSQFAPATVEAHQRTPPSAQVLPLLRVDDVVEDARYRDLCP